MRLFPCVAILFVIAQWSGVEGVKITPPKKLGPGETRVQDPGWQHCINNMKAVWGWKKLQNDNYPKFGGEQLQCSWILEAPIGWQVMIAFEDLNMAAPLGKDCRAQFIEVIDVGTGKTQGRFCGSKPPGDYVSKGTNLRIDIQGDKTIKGSYRGFVLRYKFVKKPPGFRDTRMFYIHKTTSPGKANFNNFLSQQQKRLSAKRKPGPRPPGRFVYKSDLPKGGSTTPKPDTGWHGDSDFYVGQNRRRRPVTTKKPVVYRGAKVTLRPRPRATQRTKTTTLDPLYYNTNDGWETPPNNPQDVEYQRRLYGEDNQPVKPPPSQTPANKAVKKGGLSTTHLIIIVVAIVVCFLIVVAVFAVKRIYFDKLRRYKVKEKKEREANAAALEMDEVDTLNRKHGLPGISRTESTISMRSAGNMSYRNTPLPPIPKARMTTLPPSLLRHREQALSMDQPRIYSNQAGVMMSQPGSMTLQPRGMPRHVSRHHDVTHRHKPVTVLRPRNKPNDVDEDYCSGDDETGDVTTLRREFSEWELKQQNKRKVKR